MAIIRPQVSVIQDVPDTFFSYMLVNFVYTITRSVSPTSSAVISYLDVNGNKVEVYRQEFTSHPALIEDIGSIIEPYIKSGKREFSLYITSNMTGSFERLFSVEYVLPQLVVKEEPAELSFSSALDYLIFSMIGTRDDYSAKFELKNGIEIILSETYVPDTNNEIIIRNLSSLINPYLQEKLIGDFQIEIAAFNSLNESLDNFKKTFAAQYCKSDVDMTAIEFNSKYFLSTLIGLEKITAASRKEYLHFEYEGSDENYSITPQVNADYIDDELKKSSYTFSWNIQLSAASQIVTVDVSPDKFKRKDFTLIGYTVVIGGRKQKYVIDSENSDTDPAVAFINSFGCLETFYFTGTNELDPAIKRNAAYINGMYRNYHIEEERIFKANTGVIPESMLCLVDELARSTEIYLIEKGEIGRQITVTDSETKRDNNLDTLFRASITYRVAGRNQNILHSLRPARTFDKTFDKTFE